MKAYIYDHTFEGLLSIVFDAYTRKIFPDMLLSDDETPPLHASHIHHVASSSSKADRVYRGLQQRLTRHGMNSLIYTWLSEEKGNDRLLFRFMRKVFDAQPARNAANLPTPPAYGYGTIEDDLTDPDIFAVNQTARNVSCESHLMLGFARFSLTTENIYVAPLAPRYNVLPLMLGHFASRFGEQRWILYDINRHYGYLHQNNQFTEVFFDSNRIANGRLDRTILAEGEDALQAMWRTYFNAAVIRQRINPELQRRCMPRRYWPCMTEKQTAI